MPKLSGNRGEWSEIYVFLRLLEIGKLYAADENLNKKANVFYDIIKIVRNESSSVLDFIFDKREGIVTVKNSNSGEVLLSLPTSSFREEADKLYRAIVESVGSSFTVEHTENFLNGIGVNTLKAKSDDKSDIRIKIHDINNGYEAIQGFSIKSRLGSPSTLINASKATNFKFEVQGNIDDNVANEFNTCSKKFKNKAEVLKNNHCCLSFAGMDNSIFEDNLVLIDRDLPAIISELLKLYYFDSYTTVTSAIEKVVEMNPIGYNLKNGHPFYTYKFKNLLKECALGMVPSKVWNGKVDASGGYVIVREDGEVLCYHLFNMNDFESYLLNNTKFETPSTSRHEFGEIYKEDGKYYIKLNLQVRFIK